MQRIELKHGIVLIFARALFRVRSKLETISQNHLPPATKFV